MDALTIAVTGVESVCKRMHRFYDYPDVISVQWERYCMAGATAWYTMSTPGRAIIAKVL